MKIFLLQIFLTLCITSAKAQLPEGTYASSLNSFRTNYSLKVDKDSVTLFGWETTIDKDTIYFKSTCKKHSIDRLTFTNFHFTKFKVNPGSLENFIAEPNIKMEIFLLHRYLFNFEVINKKIVLLATKDSYDSRADKFEFIKLN